MKYERVGDIIPLITTLLLVYILFYNFILDIKHITGLLLSLLGLSIWWVAKFTIGPNWGLCYGKPRLKKFVIHGIYSKLSHPIYFGVMLSFTGISIMLGNIYFTIFTIATIVFLIFRIKQENKHLKKKLGKAYYEHRKKVLI
ncbi:isoprenylcysteine carboxylmethyltransferase family protein [Candidatus Woesearchaeota archaeon]|nr:MAG: isoprenylcysteine carboxylmethyltransferase family protein [Candidatus Woesearchaeota archaeon]